MRVEEFDYFLPEELIAQTPLLDRSSSRLLVMDRLSGELSHHVFSDIVDLIPEHSVMVLNNTKVLPSRIYGKKRETDANIELLLLREKEGYWEALVKPARRVKVGTKINFNNLLEATIIRKYEDGFCHVTFTYEGIFLEKLEQLGEMPLPPYIHQKLKDQNRYQTVYATTLGSAAAPTAGLHFTKELLEKLQEKRVTICYVTLHIGLGTFRAVTSETVEEHKMHSEHYFMSQEVADILNDAKEQGKTIISVGTTSTRTLESIYQKYHKFVEVSEDTDIFIYPGYQFQVVDQLITNFHLPKSTLIMLVSAFSKLEYIKHAYQEAIDNKYRFFSFGDAMFIK
mgnify:CR=1 FL=1